MYSVYYMINDNICTSGGIKLFFPISVVIVYIIMTRITFQGSFRVTCVVDRINGSF